MKKRTAYRPGQRVTSRFSAFDGMQGVVQSIEGRFLRVVLTDGRGLIMPGAIVDHLPAELDDPVILPPRELPRRPRPEPPRPRAVSLPGAWGALEDTAGDILLEG